MGALPSYMELRACPRRCGSIAQATSTPTRAGLCRLQSFVKTWPEPLSEATAPGERAAVARRSSTSGQRSRRCRSSAVPTSRATRRGEAAPGQPDDGRLVHQQRSRVDQAGSLPAGAQPAGSAWAAVGEVAECGSVTRYCSPINRNSTRSRSLSTRTPCCLIGRLRAGFAVGTAQPRRRTAGVTASSVGGGIQEQAGEKLDRLGLLPARQASKPRTAEPKILVQNNLLEIERAPGQVSSTKRRRDDGAAGRRNPSTRDKDRKRR